MKTRFFCAPVAALILACAPAAYGQVDTEPNNTCLTAQHLGSVVPPWSFSGELLTPPSEPDVDFFRVLVPPSVGIQIELKGATGGGGTLPDPYLGAFDSDCNLLAVNDDYLGLDSRLRLTAPADGILVVGVSACCDFFFEYGGVGSYTLSFSPITAAGPITGRLVNADTGEPIGFDFGGAYVTLYFCPDNATFCNWVASQYSDSESRFRFETTAYGDVLETGAYQLIFTHVEYEELVLEPFQVDEAGLDLGDVGLQPYRLIGSISANLVDALDGRPLTGSFPDFAYALLSFCPLGPDSYCSPLIYLFPDEMGRVRFEPSPYGYPLLLVGTYRIEAAGDQYSWTETVPFTVGEGEHFDFGALGVQPLPIQLFASEGCPNAGAGGPCNFKVSLRNGQTSRFTGEVWTAINAYTPGAPYGTLFQVGKLGTVNPQPQKLNLKAGARVNLDFRLDAYTAAPVGSYFCATAFVGKNPTPLLNIAGSRYLFCLSKDANGYRVMPEKEGRQKLKELKESRTRP